MKYGKVAINLLVWLLLCNSLEAGIFNKDGKPFTQIIVAPDAPPTVKLAASEMQKYLKEVCGAELPVTHSVSSTGLPIFIGQSKELAKFNISTQKLRADEFKVVCDSKMLAIFGNDYNGPPVCGLRTPLAVVWNPKLNMGTLGSVGTLFGVYNFLEKFCGIRWYMPGPDGTVVPENKKLIIPDIDYSKHPAFAYRFVYLVGNITNNPEAILWYRRLGFGGAPNIEMNHSFSLFGEYIKTNPDYFALVDGERDFSYAGKCVKFGGGPQLCLTNPKVVDQWVNNICKYFSEHPEEGCYPVCPGDGLVRVCECPGCRVEVQKNVPEAKMFSNHIWKFINRVAEKVALKYPDKYVGCLAYETYSAPPDFKLHPNVLVMFCKKSGLFVDPAKKKAVRDKIAGWQKTMSNQQLYFWEYYFDHWLPWQNLPVIYPHIIKEDIKYMQSINAKGEKIEATEHPAVGKDDICHPGMQHLNLYVTGKLQWDPGLDIDKLLEEYFALFYGPANDEMREFWLYAEKIYADAGVKYQISLLSDYTSTPLQETLKPDNVFTPEALNKLDSLLNAAVSRTAPDSVYRKRVEIIQKEFTLGKNRLLSTINLKPSELMLTGPVKIQNGQISYSKPVNFKNNLDNSAVPAAAETRMALAWDKTNIYLKFVCFEDDIKHLKTKSQNRDDESMWRDDCIEIFICPYLGSPSSSYQIIVNAKGAVWDGKHTGTILDSKWQADIKVKSQIHKDQWTIEVQIPLKDLELNSNNLSGKSIGANFYRNRQTKGTTQYFSWSPTGNMDHNCDTATRFGVITFKPSE